MLVPSSSDSTRAAPLDGALSFSILLQEQRDITLNSAKSGVTGLLSAIQSAPQDYTTLLQTATEVLDLQNDAASRLSNPVWITTPDTTALVSALDTALTAALASVTTATSNTLAAATTAKNGTADPSTEHDLAVDVETAANALQTALAQIVAGDDATAATTVATARTDAATARNDALALLTTINGQSPVPAARIAATTAVLAAAQAVLDRADEIDAALATAVVAAAGETPTSYQLTEDTGNPTLLTVWGDSGTLSLTDASGAGVLISADGRVDSIPASGQGWQFQSDATFVLPDGTKISVTPGNPASLLATRGQQQLEVVNFGPGLTATTSLSDKGGVKADSARNDGYVFTMGATRADWTLAGAVLGDDATGRETVATTPLTNEVKIDVSNVTMPANLADKLTAIGFDAAAYDTNNDGKFNNQELQALSAAVEKLVTGAISRFDSALSRTAAAVGPMQRLNQFLARLVAASDRRQASHLQATAEEREQLRQIQRDIDEAHYGLRAAPAAKPAVPANVVAAARVVLNQVDTFGGPPTDPTPGRPRQSTPPRSERSDTGRPPSPDRIVPSGFDQSLRRAERLLSGFAGGAPLRPTLSPPAPGTPTSPTTETPAEPTLPLTSDLPADLPADALPEPAFPATTNLTPPPVEQEETAMPGVPTPAPAADPAVPPGSDSRERRAVSPARPDLSRPVPPPPFRNNPDVLRTTPPAPPSDQTPLDQPPPSGPTDSPALPSGSDRSPVSTTANENRPGREVTRPVESQANPIPPAIPSSVSNPALPLDIPAPSAPPSPDRVVKATRPAAPSGLPPLPGTGYPATGPDPLEGPDPSSGSDLGYLRANRLRLEQHLSVHREHLARKHEVQSGVRQAVEQFVALVSQDEELRQVFQADDLSDEQIEAFRGKVESIERDLGVTWGGPVEKSPQGEANLQARMLKSGMMI